MPEQKEPSLELSEGWTTGESGWGGPMTENIIKIGTLLQGSVKSVTLNQPPKTALNGDRFICGLNSVDAWAGHDLDVALRLNGTWKFYKPKYGWEFRVESLGNKKVWFDGKVWLDGETGSEVGTDPPTTKATYIQYGCWTPYKPNPGETLLFIPNLQPAILATDADGSLAKLKKPLKQDVSLTVGRDDTEIGTVTFRQGELVGVFKVASPVVFGHGDAVALTCPLDIPEDLQNFSVNLRLTLMG
ncbi:hypothetical protein WK13_34910 [Burkholderia ubonensis]|uniref:DUF2793 domain-containing protein n=1 Tax=Burkholderia ubonensis TaxID=101571 RepID=UPI00075F59CE|nr:DUF2793 domain-containing protein [Burkholderia ubonensis]KVR21732.1 hypothetical protein WK13_34910 [Burkholderia ubonensis]